MDTRQKNRYRPVLHSDISRWMREIYRDKKLTIHPAPKPDELISSWVVRLAVANELTPYTFFGIHLKEHIKALRQDFDVYSNEDMFNRLSFKTSVPVEHIKELSLISYDGVVFFVDERPKNRTFLLEYKNRGGYNKEYGIRYCPLCLKEEGYFKKKWRLYFSTVCPKHKIFLLDRCPECGKPLTLFIFKDYDNPEFHCYNCGYQFNKAGEYAEKVPPKSKVVEYQKKIYRIIDENRFEFGGREYFAVFLFVAIQRILSLLVKKDKKEHKFLDRELQIYGIQKDKLYTKGRISSLDIKTQAVLYSTALNILESPENFHRYLVENGIKYHMLTVDMDYLPFWYISFIKKYMIVNSNKVTTQEIKNAADYLKKIGEKPTLDALRKLLGVYLGKEREREVKSILFSI